MPVDTKRLPVPEESQPPYAIDNSPAQNVDLLNKKNCRCDGRQCDQVRPLFLKAGVVSQAKGSAYMEMNHTKLICAVYGPREVTRREEFSMKGQLYCEFKFATFSCQLRRQHQPDSQDKDFSLILQQALEPAVLLEKFPKARMDVFVTVLQDDGSALAGAISCASVALADAGIEMYDLVIGSSLRLFGDLMLLDPCGNEVYKSKVSENCSNNGEVTIGLLPNLHQVAAVTQRGNMECQTLMQGIKLCVEACQRIFPVLQQCLTKTVKGRQDSNT